MKQAIIKIELTMTVDVDDSVNLEEATDIALFECDAIGSIKSTVHEKMKDREVTDYTVEDAEWLDM